MNDEALITDLRRWGEHCAARYQRPPREEGGPGAHPLSRAREFAPGTRARAARLLEGRDGHARRTIMAANGSAIAGGRIAPAWATDPIPCTETRTPGPSEAAFDRGIPPEYTWVERALIELRRQWPTRVVVLEKEFTVSASQRVKARLVSQETGRTLSRWQYRRELQLGLCFLSAKRA